MASDKPNWGPHNRHPVKTPMRVLRWRRLRRRMHRWLHETALGNAYADVAA